MVGVELLVRPDLGKKPYRLKCRFLIGAFPSERILERAKYKAAEMFVADMAKQGWDYLDQYGFKMTGPFAAVQTVNLPKRSQQQRWHMPSREIIAAVERGHLSRWTVPDGPNWVKEVPRITETDDWEFELSGVFVHETIVAQYPDRHEEREGRG